MKGAAIATYLVSKEATYKKQHTLIQKKSAKILFYSQSVPFFVAIELISQKVVNPGEITNGTFMASGVIHLVKLSQNTPR